MSRPRIPAISRALVKNMYVHAEETYPHECCGMLLGPRDARDPTRVRRLKNVYDEFHAKEPEVYPRTSQKAYLMDPRELLGVEKENRASGESTKVIYHSHVDVGAYFSEEDKRVATVNGEPVFPEVAYVVISCAKGRSDGAALYWWDEKKRDFVCTEKF